MQLGILLNKIQHAQEDKQHLSSYRCSLDLKMYIHLSFVWVFLFFKTGSHYAVLAVLELFM